MKLCSYKGCTELGIHRVHDYCGYCDLHNRFRKMKAVAQQSGKSVPTFSDLESLFSSLHDFQCPKCGVEMLLTVRRGEPKGRVGSLQHWEDGTFGLLCQSCNIQHGHSKLGSRVFDLGATQKFCSDCNTIKDITEFYNNKDRPDGKAHTCKACVKIRSRKHFLKRRGLR